MAKYINSVIIEGNLCRDVEMKYSNSGTAIADLSIAYNDNYKKGEEWVEQSYFFDVSAFRDTATACAPLTKGTLVHVEGKMTMDKWKDSDGKDRSKVKIIAFKVEPMARNNAPNGTRTGQGATQPVKATNPTTPNNGRPSTVPFKNDIPGEDSIPFSILVH